MSFRGGRGGRFSGRGGLGGGGAPMTEEERKAGSYAFPTPTYPPVAVPLQSKPSRLERLCASQFLQFRNQVRESPFYIGSYIGPLTEDGALPGKKRKITSIAIEIDNGQQLNDGIKRYTDRYTKKRRIGGKRAIEEHPYVIEFFPKELYEAMGHVTSGTGKKTNRKLDLSKFTAELLLTEAGEYLEDDDPETRDRKLKAKIEELKASAASGKDDKEDDDKSDENNDEPEEEFDDEFESDDDDDYNAEKYFDDGEGGDDDDGNDEAAY